MATLHSLPENKHATFQVASQFNCLEFVAPSITPEQGITKYEADKTQGPACSLACGAACVVRNYFVQVEGNDTRGQSSTHQISNLSSLMDELQANHGGPFFSIQGGYVMPLTAVDGHDPRLQRLCDLLKIDSERDKLRSLLRIGVQSDCEVTSRNWGRELTDSPEQLVS